MRTPEEILEILAQAVGDSAVHLAQKIKNGEPTAADIAMALRMFKDAGGSLTFGAQPTALGDEVLASMAELDDTMFN